MDQAATSLGRFTNLSAAKRSIATLGFPITRMLVRRLPPSDVVLRLLTGLFNPHLSWRPFETTITTVDEVRMRIRFPDKIQKHLYLFGVWEPAISGFVRSRLTPGDLFIDVGANVGYYSLLAAKRVGPRGAVVAIEASPSIAGALRANIALNGFGNIEVIQRAVADRRKTVQVFLGPDDNLGMTTIVGSDRVAARRSEARVEASSLPDLVGVDRLRSARLVKVDVEGAEADVFDGLRSVLPTFGLETEWIFEVTPGALMAQGRSAGEIMALFAANGYRLYAIENGYRMEHYLRPPAPALEEIRSIPDACLTVDVIATKREHEARVPL
jgi:FkbM family methyltransferase